MAGPAPLLFCPLFGARVSAPPPCATALGLAVQSRAKLVLYRRRTTRNGIGPNIIFGPTLFIREYGGDYRAGLGR